MNRNLLAIALMGAMSGAGAEAVAIRARQPEPGPPMAPPLLPDIGRATPPPHRQRGYSAAHVKRMAHKRRNRLRAKGQHRKAVR